MTFQPCAVHYFLFFSHQPSDSLPSPCCLSFRCKPRGESPLFPTELALSLCYTWHTGWLNLQLEIPFNTRFIKKYVNTTTTQVCGIPNAQAGQESELPAMLCFTSDTHCFSLYWFSFIWFWKCEYVQFVAVSILSMYLLFFRHTYIYINAIYI